MKVTCQHCGQITSNKKPCQYCGAPTPQPPPDDEELEEDPMAQEMRARWLGPTREQYIEGVRIGKRYQLIQNTIAITVAVGLIALILLMFLH